MSGKVLVHGVNILPKEKGGLYADTDGTYVLAGPQGIYVGPADPGGYPGFQGSPDDYGYLQLTLAGANTFGAVLPPNTASGKYLDETGGWTVPGGGSGFQGPQGLKGDAGADGIPKTLDEPSGLVLNGDALKIKVDFTTNQTLAITADGISVATEADGGIEALAGEGLEIKLDDPGSGLSLSADGLKVIDGGTQGLQGVQGPQGRQGWQGWQGQGPQGNDGPSATFLPDP